MPRQLLWALVARALCAPSLAADAPATRPAFKRLTNVQLRSRLITPEIFPDRDLKDRETLAWVEKQVDAGIKTIRAGSRKHGLEDYVTEERWPMLAGALRWRAVGDGSGLWDPAIDLLKRADDYLKPIGHSDDKFVGLLTRKDGARPPVGLELAALQVFRDNLEVKSEGKDAHVFLLYSALANGVDNWEVTVTGGVVTAVAKLEPPVIKVPPEQRLR